MPEIPTPVAGSLPTVPDAGERKPLPPSRPPPAGRRGVLWHFVSIATGVIAGASLLLIAHKYLAAKVFPPPQVAINYQVFSTPNPKLVTDILIPAINVARTEILVSANDISSRLLLEALAKKHARGVDVVILMSSDAGNSRSVQWIRNNKAGRLFVDSNPSTDQFVVVDGRNVILTSIPFNSTAPSEVVSTGIAVDDATLAMEMRRVFFKRLTDISPAS